MYHQASAKHGLAWAWLDASTLTFNDAVIISVPFSDSGNMPTDIDIILDNCDYFKIPVLIDLAYLPMSKNIRLDLRYDCIETVCASVSKVFDGAQYLRAGIRFQRVNIDDGIDIANSVGMVPANAMSTAVYLMNKYPIDYNWNTYADEYHAVCTELNLSTTNCIMFGTSTTDYMEYNRGNSWNRVCISQDIGNKHASTKS